MTNKFVLHNGDCVEVMKTMEDNSVDSIVCDPPYELGFMGKHWDSSGIAYNVDMWKEVLRVLKPGGRLLAFGGTRTYHRMTCAIEDAGFEIKDCIMWIYSGFPKSLNIAKAITALETTGGSAPRNLRMSRQGEDYTPTGQKNYRAGRAFSSDIDNDTNETVLTPTAKQWEGWGTALKPAHEPVVLAMKPISEKTIAENVLKWGTGGINIDGCRVGDEEHSINRFTNGAKPWGNAVGEDFETVTVNGRFPANIIHDGSDEVVGMFPESKSTGGVNSAGKFNNQYGKFSGDNPGKSAGGFGDSGSAARFFYSAKASKSDRNEGCDDLPDKEWRHDSPANPERNNRPFIPSKNNHPTVKPTELMKYLCRLVTPKGGIVLDPFMGSGSTGKAAMLEGFSFVGIEREKEYFVIAKKRIEHAQKEFRNQTKEIF